MAGKFIVLGGSICLSDLNAQAKLGHSAFSRAEKNGKIYFNFTQFVNEEANDFGQHSSLLLNSSSKEKAVEEGKIYIGNAKKLESTGGTPLEAGADDLLDDSETLPF